MAKKILLAEDSITMQQVVEMTFAGEDVVLTTVSTAEEALARAKEARPDVVLADLSLAGKNGYDICAELKRQGERPGVILLHGIGAKFDPSRARQVQADGDIAKPFDTQALIDIVNEVASAEPQLAVPGPIESLSAPIESAEEVPVAPSLRQQPAAARPAPAPAVGMPPLPMGTPPAPAMSPPVVSAPVPPRSIGGAAPPPSAPSARGTPMSPAAMGMPPVPAAGSDRPITIEAQPPPISRREPLQPFTGVKGSAPQIVSSQIRPAATKIGLGPGDGVGLPPPPPGMPLPGTGQHAAARPVAAKPVAAKPVAAKPVAAKPVAAEPVVPAVPQGGPSQPAAAAATVAGIDPAVYEAVSKLTKEVVERIVWEVVPDLAEAIIKEQLDRLVEKRAK